MTLDIYIRWMIRNDMPYVLEIENSSFEFPWTEEDFTKVLRERNCIGMVAEYGDLVLGYMIYELRKSKLHVLSLAVHPEYRRRRIGTQMVNKLIEKLSHQRRNRIVLEVRETNMDACLFFHECGFLATSVIQNFYDDTTEDAYKFVYRLPQEEFSAVC